MTAFILHLQSFGAVLWRNYVKLRHTLVRIVRDGATTLKLILRGSILRVYALYLHDISAPDLTVHIAEGVCYSGWAISLTGVALDKIAFA